MLIDGVACYRGVPGARARVVERVEEARERGFDELAWRGYIVTVTTDMEHGELRSAQRACRPLIGGAAAKFVPNNIEEQSGDMASNMAAIWAAAARRASSADVPSSRTITSLIMAAVILS